MKILSTTKNTYNFKGGMNKKVLSEVAHVDCVKVQKKLLKNNNINADFAGNNIIAWSVSKIVDLFLELQKKYNRPFFTPIQITTESLENYGKANEKGIMYGFTNFLPSRLKNNTNEVTPAMSIIFNKDFPWEDLDEISDVDYAKKQTTTNHFLESFIHEFFHIFHEGHLLTKYPPKEAVTMLKDLANPEKTILFQEKFSDLISKEVCNYAKESPFDLVACDMSKRFIASLDTNNLQLIKNPFKKSPYSQFYNFIKLRNKQIPLDNLINDIYNGRL